MESRQLSPQRCHNLASRETWFLGRGSRRVASPRLVSASAQAPPCNKLPPKKHCRRENEKKQQKLLCSHFSQRSSKFPCENAFKEMRTTLLVLVSKPFYPPGIAGDRLVPQPDVRVPLQLGLHLSVGLILAHTQLGLPAAVLQTAWDSSASVPFPWFGII